MICTKSQKQEKKALADAGLRTFLLALVVGTSWALPVQLDRACNVQHKETLAVLPLLCREWLL